MSPSVVPAHTKIDFRKVIEPTRGWIVGVAETRSRVELLAFEEPPADDGLPVLTRGGDLASQVSGVAAAELSGCTCPDFCERDHENE